MRCDDLANALRRDPLTGWRCSQGDGFLTIETPFRYSDGGTVELYAEERPDGAVLFTDYGESFRFLQTYGLEPLRSGLRKQIIELALELGGATTSEGAIEVVVPQRADVFDGLARLGQIVTRVSDLALLARGSLAATFPDAVEEFLRSRLRFAEVERNGTLSGRATTHKVDLLVRTQEALTALAALSAVTANGANAQTAFTIQKFADIAALGDGAPQRVTVIDDSADVWSEALRRQLQNFSDVVDWERRDDLIPLVGGDDRKG